jgi:UDP-GlcNAc:undecaprenyl-phosphate/decaprenyl-phosphate GlcNAc-1-phosphate transferase
MDFLDLMAAANDKILAGFRAPLLTGIIALIVSWVLTPWVRKLAIQQGAVDDPNRDDRRIHKEPLPRWGGLAIYAGMVVALAVVLPFAFPKTQAYPLYLIGMVLMGGILVVVGALDDLYQFSAKIQALILLGVGIAVQFFAGHIGQVQIKTIGVPLSSPPEHIYLFWAAIPLTAIYIFIVTKTMDTIDGVDGLAAGIATISAATLVVIAVYGEQPRVAIIAAAIGGSALGFLKHNYNPAKIIMGTGGAYILGFMLACLSIVGAFKTATAIALVIPIFVFGVPIFDAFFVVTRRILSKQPITQADKRHLHHTLLNKGLSQRQVVWVLYLAALTLCGALLVVIKLYA